MLITTVMKKFMSNLIKALESHESEGFGCISNAKATHIFSAKIYAISNESFNQSFNNTLTNDIISFEFGPRLNMWGFNGSRCVGGGRVVRRCPVS